MATKPSSTSGGTVEPFTSPMNLTCVTATTNATPAGTPPSTLLILIRTDGHAPPAAPPGQGWSSYIAPDANAKYTITFNGETLANVNGAGIAVFGK